VRRATPWLAACLIALVVSAVGAKGADVLVGSETAADARTPVARVSHAEWDRLLRSYVDGDGLVDYRRWKSDGAGSASLDNYLATLSTASLEPPSPRAAVLAYWINAYNAVTVRGILREYPTTSIKNHTALFGYNIWRDLKLRVGDELKSLDDIEHRVLRPLGEPRIHFALVCASRGCPRLLDEAYVAERLDGQLDRNARHFFAQPANFRVGTGGKVFLSSILQWYGEDFGSGRAEVLRRLAPWAPATSRPALDAPNASVSYLPYDWSLNEQPRNP
jgi:hypothetical protein